MKKSVKAALFSAFIFPGAGQLLLKKYISAVYFAIFASIGLYLLFSNLLTRTQAILDKVQSGEISADIGVITAELHQQTASIAGSLSPALVILLVAWLVSVVEAYRVGSKDDRL